MQQTIVMSLADATLLAEGVDLTVDVHRGNKEPYHWEFEIPALAISEWGFTDQKGLSKLAIKVRGTVQDVLKDPEPSPTRSLVLKLWVADCAGTLERLLEDSLSIKDEHIERLIREQCADDGGAIE